MVTIEVNCCSTITIRYFNSILRQSDLTQLPEPGLPDFGEGVCTPFKGNSVSFCEVKCAHSIDDETNHFRFVSQALGDLPGDAANVDIDAMQRQRRRFRCDDVVGLGFGLGLCHGR